MSDAQAQVLCAVNPAFALRRGYASPDELVGQPVASLFAPARAAEAWEQIREADRLGHRMFETEHVCRDGSTFPVLVDVTVIKAADGTPATRIVHVLDTTALKSAEARLRQEQDRRRALFDEAAPDPTYITDHDGRILEANRRACETLGYTLDELLQLSVFDIEKGFGDAASTKAVWAAVAPGSHQTINGRHRRKDGSLFPVETHFSVLVEDAQRLYISVVRDVTEREKADALLRDGERRYRELSERLEQRVIERTAQLEQASRAKTDFLANMSHELRTPLNAIIGFSELLKDGMLGELDSQQLRFVGDIWDAGKHLHSLINDVLDLSKVEAGMLEVELNREDVEPLLQSTLTMVHNKAMKQGVKLAARLAPDVGTIDVDKRKVKQIVYNLLTNAVKFTGHGGAVELSARRSCSTLIALAGTPARILEFNPGAAQEFLEICVTDTGHGIPARTPAETVRTLRPAQGVVLPQPGRHRARPLPRPQVCRTARRHRRRRQFRRPWRPVLRVAAVSRRELKPSSTSTARAHSAGSGAHQLHGERLQNCNEAAICRLWTKCYERDAIRIA